jgi:hypothetical protein
MKTARALNLALVAVSVLLMCPLLRAQQEKTDRDAIVASFKQYIKDNADSYKTNPREHVVQSSLDSHWRKLSFSFEPDYSIDIRTTDSLISPYLGICEFVIVSHTTAPHSSEAEAEKDNNFIEDRDVKHRHEYAFHDGHWVPVSRKQYQPLLSEWFDCDDGCLVKDCAGCWEEDAEYPVKTKD